MAASRWCRRWLWSGMPQPAQGSPRQSGFQAVSARMRYRYARSPGLPWPGAPRSPSPVPSPPSQCPGTRRYNRSRSVSEWNTASCQRNSLLSAPSRLPRRQDRSSVIHSAPKGPPGRRCPAPGLSGEGSSSPAGALSGWAGSGIPTGGRTPKISSTQI